MADDVAWNASYHLWDFSDEFGVPPTISRARWAWLFLMAMGTARSDAPISYKRSRFEQQDCGKSDKPDLGCHPAMTTEIAATNETKYQSTEIPERFPGPLPHGQKRADQTMDARVENFSFLGPVGVMLSSCIMTPEPISHSTRTAHDLVVYNCPSQAILLPSPRSAVCIIAMSVEPREIGEAACF